jgi:hypothetical protein
MPLTLPVQVWICDTSDGVPFEPQHHPVLQALGPEGLAVLEGADRQSLIEAVIEVGSVYEDEGYQIVIVNPVIRIAEVAG